jgi:hypothetical protein
MTSARLRQHRVRSRRASTWYKTRNLVGRAVLCSEKRLSPSAPTSFTYESEDVRFSVPVAVTSDASSLSPSPSDPAFPLVADERTQAPTSLATDGTVDPKDSPVYSASSSPYPLLSPSPYPHSSLSPHAHNLRLPVFALLVCIMHLYEIRMPLFCVLRSLRRPGILLHLVRMARGPEVSLTYGIHSRFFCPHHSRLLVLLTIVDMGESPL